MMEKLGLFMNGAMGDNIEFSDLKKMPNYIAKVRDDFVELIEYTDMSIDDAMKIVKKAFLVNEGSENPFTKEESRQFNT